MQPEARFFLHPLTAAAVAGLMLLGGCSSPDSISRSGSDGSSASNVIVLGFDGLDYDLTRKLMEEGRMPNFSRLDAENPLAKLGTSAPPQSPVAWSDFITGMDAGGHGIFDFVHRDPKTMAPYLSTSRVVADPAAGEPFQLGECQVPTSGGEMELLRHGTPFWETLEEHGIETTILRMPANFPPSGTATRELSGMGTPDLLGTYGTFTFYTSELFFDDSDISGGKVVAAWPENGVVVGTLDGPPNPFVRKKEKAQAPFEVRTDPDEPVAKLVVGDEERILQVGEWSDWVPVALDLGTCGKLMMTPSLPAMARFYLKSLTPEFQLYVSPLNLDPMDPVMPISTPASYAADLAEGSGRYFTQGMPEDTKALEGKVLDRAQFLEQAHLSRDEMLVQYRQILADWKGGLMFYYMGTADQISHVLWDTLDPEHPRYDPVESPKFADAIPDAYVALDGMVGYTLEHMPPNTTLVVMSDHGFTSWRRAFNLNTWLWKNGYLAVRDAQSALTAKFFGAVAWDQTRAYGLGINGLYVNVVGREKKGSVPESERQQLMEEIRDKLLATLDPKTGLPAVTRVYLREETFSDGGYRDIGPDIIVGYAKGTRASSASSLGELSAEVFADNVDDWPGDHLMDHESVPGILLTNRPLPKPAPALRDLSGAILAVFGVETDVAAK
ncbi:MAG: alkaline phosphatase family protein [Thermoanaerobaculia bacterium]|nr:alkaline phosphatase family protein [Thermoanaerobaculia bacterium]